MSISISTLVKFTSCLSEKITFYTYRKIIEYLERFQTGIKCSLLFRFTVYIMLVVDLIIVDTCGDGMMK